MPRRDGGSQRSRLLSPPTGACWTAAPGGGFRNSPASCWPGRCCRRTAPEILRTWLRRPDSRMRAFFIECSGGHWVRIALQLAADRGVVPALWSGDVASLDKVRAAFPTVVTVVGVDAACGELPAASRWKQSPLDEPLLRAQ